jgi:hypothetical protein
MKKYIVLFILFIFPIVAYLFFASGVNSFVKLPIVTKNIPDISEFKTADGKSLTLNQKITILGFSGSDIIYNQGNYFNLNQKIYNKNFKFNDFQMIIIAPLGSEKQSEDLLKKLSQLSDVSNWHFVFGTPESIQNYHNKLQLAGGLDQKNGTSNVYIIDKEKNLRGRKGNGEYKEGYNTISAADLHNEMSDDVKVILAEYRLALKKYKRKI